MWLTSRARRLALIVLALSTPAFGQQSEPSAPGGGLFSAVVLNAPFSATALTRVTETLPDGTVGQHLITATYHRNSRGRVLAVLDNPWGQYVLLWMPDLALGQTRGATYMLEPDKRTYRLGGRSMGQTVFNGEGRVALPIGRACFRTIPQVFGASTKDRLEAVNARMSPDLGIALASHRSDASVSVEYEVTKIRREEPPAEWFEIPANYTFVKGSTDDPLMRLSPWSTKPSCK